MNYYRHFAVQTAAASLKKPFVYLIASLFSVFAVLIMRNIGQAALTPRMLEFFSMAIIFNGLLPVCYISVYLCAQQVFFVEKKQRSMTMVLCSPAGLREIFWGKTAGLFLSAFIVPVLVMALFVGIFTPRETAALASWSALAAFGVVCGMGLAYTAVIGIGLLSARDERVVTVALYLFTAAQLGLTRLTKAAAGHGLFGGIVFQYAGIMLGLALLSAGVYFFYFSKARVVDSV